MRVSPESSHGKNGGSARNRFSPCIDFCRNNAGSNVVEFALLIPVLALIALATIEFGIWFAQYEIATRAVNNSSYAIMQNPGNVLLQNAARQSGLSFVSFASPNYICAQAYATEAAAKAGLCTGQWATTAAAAGVSANASYFVAVKAYVKHTPIPGVPNWLGDIAVSTVVEVIVAYAPPTCTGDQFLVYTPANYPAGNPWTCTAPPACNLPGQYLQYSAAYAAANPNSPTGGWTCSYPVSAAPPHSNVALTPPGQCPANYFLQWNGASAWSCAPEPVCPTCYRDCGACPTCPEGYENNATGDYQVSR